MIEQQRKLPILVWPELHRDWNSLLNGPTGSFLLLKHISSFNQNKFSHILAWIPGSSFFVPTSLENMFCVLYH
ncbi:hypothetical protein ACP275_08G006500 [Erythranthe tilingii]